MVNEWTRRFHSPFTIYHLPLQMQVVTRRKRISAVDLRARVPAIARGLALFLLVGGVIFVGVSYYKMRHNTPFRMRSETPALSKEITGIIEGYEQRMTKGDRLYLWLRAARDVSYADGHHELEQVNLQVFPPTGDKPDQITSDRAIYDQKKGAGQFTGNVQIETHEALKVKTDSLVYHQDNEVAETSSPITFERENVSGKATGALVDDKNKRLELRNDVEVTVAPEAFKDPNKKDTKPLKGARAKPVTIHSAQAVFEQTSMRLTFSRCAATRTCVRWTKDTPRKHIPWIWIFLSMAISVYSALTALATFARKLSMPIRICNSAARVRSTSIFKHRAIAVS